MYTNLTELSREAYDYALNEMVTIDDGIRFLEEQLQLRTILSKFMKFSKGRDVSALKASLTRGLIHNHPDKQTDSLRRRVDGWLNPQNTNTLYKQDALEAAFLLGLTLDEADDFVTMITGERLHYRNVKEIVFIYGLNNGLDFLQTQTLSKRMAKYFEDVKDKIPESLSQIYMTENIRPAIKSLHTEKELRRFLQEEKEHLGQLHNSAYKLFCEMINKLKKPVSQESIENYWQEEEIIAKEKLTVRDIMHEYLFQDSVLKEKQKAFRSKKLVKKGTLPKDQQYILSKIKDIIVKDWPDESYLSDIKNRKKDVTRKVLILLYLATFSEDETPYYYETDQRSGNDDAYFDDKEAEREALFKKIYDGINYMLALCGFGPLDPRGPFDWIIIYSICAEDLLDMDTRMKSLFLKMFPEDEELNNPVNEEEYLKNPVNEEEN